MNQAKKIILERIDKNISVAALAEDLYVNASHLTRVFRKETGRSVIKYIQYCKIERVRELLRQPGIKIYQVEQIPDGMSFDENFLTVPSSMHINFSVYFSIRLFLFYRKFCRFSRSQCFNPYFQR